MNENKTSKENVYDNGIVSMAFFKSILRKVLLLIIYNFTFRATLTDSLWKTYSNYNFKYLEIKSINYNLKFYFITKSNSFH